MSERYNRDTIAITKAELAELIANKRLDPKDEYYVTDGPYFRNAIAPDAVDGAGNSGGIPGLQTIQLTGDSKTAANGGVSVATPVQALGASYDSKGAFNQANFRLGHIFDQVGNAGIGGQRSVQIADRFGSDILSRAAAWVCIMAGTNDQTAADNTVANILGMWDKAIAAGRKVVALTIPPQTSATDAVNQYHMSVNWALKIQAATRANVVLVEHDQATQDINTVFKAIAGTLTDGTHESAYGAQLEGAYIAERVAPYTKSGNPLLATGNSDPTNLVSNGMLNGTGATLPTGWAKVGTAGVISYVPRPGKTPWCQIAVPNGAVGGQGLTSNVSIGAGVAVGDTVVAVIEFESDALDPAAAANTQGVCFKVQCYNGSSFFSSVADLYWDTTYANYQIAASGVFQTPRFVIPATTTVVQIYLSINGGGNYRVSRAALRNLTTLGLA